MRNISTDSEKSHLLTRFQEKKGSFYKCDKKFQTKFKQPRMPDWALKQSLVHNLITRLPRLNLRITTLIKIGKVKLHLWEWTKNDQGAAK